MSLLRTVAGATLVLACCQVQAVASGEDAIHSIAYSHQDNGYANYPHVLRTEVRLENLFRSIRYCDETAGWPVESQYRYQQEIAEALPAFLSAATPEQREKFIRYVKEGRIGTAATHTTVLAERLTPEAAARLFYLGNRLVPDLLGTPPSTVAIINDVIALPWCMPVYCEAARVPFLSLGHNTCARCDELESAPLVRWLGPKGTGSVLAFSAVYNYHAVSNPQKEVPATVARDAQRITPNYIPAWLQGHDFAITKLDMAMAVKSWNEQGRPKVWMSTLPLYLDALARKQTPEKTPAVSKTGPCQWIDQALADAWMFGRARQAAERLPAAEKFATFALSAGAGGYPWFDFTRGWHLLLSHFEHTSGAACWRCKNEEGWRHYETELVEHREEGLAAAAAASLTLDGALDRLTGRIAAARTNTVAVFNSLGQARTDIVTLRAPALAGQQVAAVDDATGAVTPCQWLEGQTLGFVAVGVPPLGYRTFHLVEAPSPAVTPGTSPAGAENPFYRIALDPQSGALASIVDKELGRELVKADAKQAFNQYLYQRYDAPMGPPAKWSNPPTNVSVTSDHGPVASVFRVRGQAEGVAWFEQTITLYHGIKRIDFALRLDKQPSGRSLADYLANNLRGKEAVFVALPLNIPDFKAVYQTGGASVAEPVRDQFTGSGTASFGVQHFADLSNDRFGVTVSPLDCSLVQFGYPRSDAVSRALPGSESAFEKQMEYPKNASLYLYLLNNMFTTNIRIDQRGEHLFRWALRSHAGDWQAGEANRFGEGVNQPLLARLVKPGALPPGEALPAGVHAFASVDAPGVSVSTVKPAEWNGEGFIVRLVETGGRAATARVKLPFLGAIAAANETSLTEDDLDKPLAVTDGVVAIALPAYGVKTIRVRGEGAPCGVVTRVTAAALSDMEIALAWERAPGAAFYRVYRGATADFQPSPLTLVATADEPRCVDKTRNHYTSWIANRLHPETTYHYRVEAVTQQNRRGPASPAVSAVTLATARKACPPGPVQDLHAILVSLHAPVNQINLLWRSNVEPNIGGYEIHRSTRSGFTPGTNTLLATLESQRSSKATVFKEFDHQMYLDAKPEPGSTYYYRVRAVTKAGLYGAYSREAVARTKPHALNGCRTTAQSTHAYGNPAWALDGLPDPDHAWISLQYGGGTKDAPRDVWWAVEFPAPTPPVAGVKIVGDHREVIPQQTALQLQVRENGAWRTVAQVKDATRKDVTVKFPAALPVSGLRMLVPAKDLPKSVAVAKTDGYVRICEFKALMPDGSEKNPVDLFAEAGPVPRADAALLGNDAGQQ